MATIEVPLCASFEHKFEGLKGTLVRLSGTARLAPEKFRNEPAQRWDFLFV